MAPIARAGHLPMREQAVKIPKQSQPYNGPNVAESDLEAIELARRRVTRSTIATLVALAVIALALWPAPSHPAIRGTNGKPFPILEVAQRQRGTIRWLSFRFLTQARDESQIASEVTQLLPAASALADGSRDTVMEITASRPLVRIGILASLYHSYSVVLRKRDDQWVNGP